MSLHFAYRRYTVPFRIPVRTAHGLWTHREGVLVKLTDAKGRSGIGEAAPIPWFGTETADEIESACRSIGDSVQKHTALPVRLGCLTHAWKSALRALATEPTTSRHAYLPVVALLPAGRAALERIKGLAEAGFRTFKWKVGVGDPSDERALLDDLLAALPNGAKLRLDANGAWVRREAERWLAYCADRPIEFVEQPVSPDAPAVEDSLLGLAGDFPTRIALDESVATLAQLERWLAAGWPGVFVIKPSLIGDVDLAFEKLAKAKSPVVVSSAMETAIGAYAALRLALAFPGELLALGFGVYPLFVDNRLDGPAVAPFVRREDLERFDPEAVWNVLS
ncbi:o-succinylbenzoate synthase [Opitutaceae bacterium EW11]|nr:o-succinylbenzoate synthase [Opitutaceae bacterium EW11]